MFFDYEGTEQTEYVTPEQFGAVGDGVTDDGAAIQLALGNGNRSVVFSRKTYCIRTRCYVYSNTKIIGNDTKFLAYVNPITIGHDGNYAYAYDGSNNVEISGLDIDLNGYGTDHIIMAHGQNIYIHNCIFRHNSEHAIELNSSKNVTFENCVFTNIAPDVTSKEAINIDPAATGHTLNMGYFDNTISDYVKVINCLFENCWAAIGNHGETPYGSKNILFRNNDVRNCFRGVQLHSYKNVRVEDCFFDTADIGARIVGAENIIVSKNQFDTDEECVKIETASTNIIVSENIGISGAVNPIDAADKSTNVSVLNNLIQGGS